MTLLEVRGLSVHYGAVQAVHEVDFTVEEGAVVSLLGANGAGKTSTIKAICGAAPYRGSIRFRGRSLPQNAARVRAAGVGHVPEGRHVFGGLTVADNLRLGGWGKRRDRSSEIYQLFPRLAERRRQLAGTLSGGEQQMLAIGRALMGEPDLLLLDEPTLGLAPVLCDEIFDRIRDVSAMGSTLVLVQQHTSRALALADYVLVMRGGRVIARGIPDDFADEEALSAAYLGDEMPHGGLNNLEKT
ncbi:ABC transporter ATP-binding protein [Microtetraspora sp. NBRC 16547]|uniref:ABC transporter ATP-binding protein n=1 Tax=Microtetraspora sp. NBRC 16547 TaxID=3030993 RepID=UPI0024A5C150|nr:ABC transporter ATP-binding protein [Microtetraspora sp. NBRC 16547]GLW99333.1 ABC transporter ATP-binding protein [Microtetraspora sp. NBRC 16547]